MTTEEQKTLDLLVRKLIKSVHDDFHHDFINYECRESIKNWHESTDE